MSAKLGNTGFEGTARTRGREKEQHRQNFIAQIGMRFSESALAFQIPGYIQNGFDFLFREVQVADQVATSKISLHCFCLLVLCLQRRSRRPVETTYLDYSETVYLPVTVGLDTGFPGRAPGPSASYSTNELSHYSQNFRVHTLSIFPVKPCTFTAIDRTSPGFVTGVGAGCHYS